MLIAYRLSLSLSKNRSILLLLCIFCDPSFILRNRLFIVRVSTSVVKLQQCIAIIVTCLRVRLPNERNFFCHNYSRNASKCLEIAKTTTTTTKVTSSNCVNLYQFYSLLFVFFLLAGIVITINIMTN